MTNGVHRDILSLPAGKTPAAREVKAIEKKKGAAAAAWDKANTVQVKLKLMKSTDADILAKLDKVESKQGYIKSLIRADLAKDRNE